MVTLFKNVTPSAVEPDDPLEGYVYLDDGTNTASGAMGFRRYNGSAWADFGLQSVAETISLTDLDDVTYRQSLMANGWCTTPQVESGKIVSRSMAGRSQIKR